MGIIVVQLSKITLTIHLCDKQPHSLVLDIREAGHVVARMGCGNSFDDNTTTKMCENIDPCTGAIIVFYSNSITAAYLIVGF